MFIRCCFCVLLSWSFSVGFSQSVLGPLTVEKIMQDPKWIGTSPTAVEWSADGKFIYFKWNPDNSPADSLYHISITNPQPQKIAGISQSDIVYASQLVYNRKADGYVYSKDGDIFFKEVKTGGKVQITQTADTETNPMFAFSDKWVLYQRDQNLFAWEINTGATLQLTNFLKGTDPKKEKEKTTSEQETWLKKDQLEWMEVVKQRKEKKQLAEAYTKSVAGKEKLRNIYTGDKSVSSISVSADARFIAYRLNPVQNRKATIVPEYVNVSGFTSNLNTRPKVGAAMQPGDWFIFDRLKDTILSLSTDSLPGITDIPAFLNDYPALFKKHKEKPARLVNINGLSWSPNGTLAVLDMKSGDNKDRWLATLDPVTGVLSVLDRQHDDAWIGGPGISRSATGWVNEELFWYQSEVTGYSHLYTVNVKTGIKKALTSGNYEVQKCKLSSDKKFFYVTSNQVHPGEQQFYRLPVAGGVAERITALTGANDVVLSPDEKKIAFLYSYSNKPWELYLQDNKPGARPQQLTFKAQSDTFQSYAWRDPELVQIKARDGKEIYARLYQPTKPHPSKPAVIFVHGAGYLQNAHKWWSSYFREYMFHNLLADNGYYVLDIDYRASSGYGRDWRTGIYRHMGGKDLEDHIDGAKWLVDNMGVDAKRIGIYGGSYGGFITLMGLFTSPGTFAAGAALRPVTDWAHYNHEYTSNILNTPAEDSIAYRKSSPIYFAEGLKDHLLICHGMVDVNVHVQDVIRLNQRLIELGKDNWELALYPMEDHGFAEPSSWTDEYKRIYKLFEEVLKK